jgi:hypothetical protein
VFGRHAEASGSIAVVVHTKATTAETMSDAGSMLFRLEDHDPECRGMLAEDK